jgi:hypothetical protein
LIFFGASLLHDWSGGYGAVLWTLVAISIGATIAVLLADAGGHPLPARLRMRSS